MVSTIEKWRFQCERQKCKDEELEAILDDDQIQTKLSSIMINLKHALIEKRPEWAKRHGKVILLHNNVSHIKTGERNLEIAWMGHSCIPAVIL